jgi:hypothetical protein
MNKKSEHISFVFCCRADNDLFRVVTTNRGTQTRYSDTLEAVQQAPEGAGILILADGYPKERTPVAPAVLDLAARKKLRVYIEYPAGLPGLSFGEPAYMKTGPYGAVLERTVVASDAFGPGLPKMRILMVNDCHYLPVDAADPHLVLTIVEGYDTAVYGLSGEIHPLLFNHPKLNILVATTKLSQFVTARYAPTEAWPAVWKMILGWLQPEEKTRPLLTWTPTVRPMYQPNETLPPDAEEQAMRRGIEYYDKSRLYIHPAWPKSTGLEPILPDWPMGDGTHGIGECYISKRTFVDGSQAASRTVRTDCNLESAMGLAFGAAVLGDPKYGETAGKLADYIFFHPELMKEPFTNPEHPSYGLYPNCWVSDQAKCRYYADDNVRAILGGIAMGALLKSDRWDDVIVRCILANFRTGGIYGFRPQVLVEDELQQTGWRHHFNSEFIDYCPHYQSWIWTTYLWLYTQTGFAPLLERTRTAFRMIMAEYPNWSPEANRVEQEPCRMLLPLAWLVRVDDTPEHRQWLDTVARYVIDLQDASGAIPQIASTLVPSNEDYGTGECAIVHQAGDPATDLLYSINFAFIGMHEAAAATGNPDYAKSADRMADFFVRSQTRSEKHPELDGTWYRSFDFRKWEYWGSDGDLGWGVWTNEIGWTHSWITVGLALRQMKTCLWDLCRTTHVGHLFDVNCKRMLKDIPERSAADRKEVDLCGTWQFCPDPQDRGVNEKWFAGEFDAASWRPVKVPIGFCNCGPEMDRYIGAGWFRRTFHVPEAVKGRRVVLYFEGINYNAAVWVNGKQVGESHDAYLPFELPVGDVVQYGRENLIVVRVDNFRQVAQFPLFEGWFGQGGFLREARLVATNPVYLEHIGITAEPVGSVGIFRLKATISNADGMKAEVAIAVNIRDRAGKDVAAFISGKMVELTPGTEVELTIHGEIPNASSWSPNDSALYTAHVCMHRDGVCVDRMSTRFGIRRVEVKDAKILLNGKPLFLMGFNRHEDSPRTGMAVDLELAKTDFEDMKRIGCNYVRFCHYPHHPGELDLCDEMGLLVMTENAMNQWGSPDFNSRPHKGLVPAPEDAPLVLENGRRTLRKMVNRDMNHPCIILCSVGNESTESREDVMKGNSELIEYGKQLDPTRLWVHVSRDYKETHYRPDYYRSDDVIVINTYPTHYVEFSEENIKAGFPSSTQWMRDQLEKLHRDFPHRPILIGEFGLHIDQGEEAQAAAVAAEFAALTEPYVAGGGLWHYALHRWPDLDDHQMSPYGYMSRDRQTRYKAMSVIEKLFKAKAASRK